MNRICDRLNQLRKQFKAIDKNGTTCYVTPTFLMSMCDMDKSLHSLPIGTFYDVLHTETTLTRSVAA